MKKQRSIAELIALYRPPGAPANEVNILAEIAEGWRLDLVRVLAEINKVRWL